MKGHIKTIKKNIENISALTPMQEGILFHYLRNQKADLYFVQICLEIHGKIDVRVFSKVWDYLIESNESLRSIFRWEKLEKPLQITLKHHSFNSDFIDLIGLEEQETKKKLNEIKIKDRKNYFDLKKIPFRVTLCRIENNHYEMIISNHHILYDGWSTGIILREFFENYNNLSIGRDLYRPLKSKFSTYVKWIQDLDSHNASLYWKSYLDNLDALQGISIKQIKPISPGVSKKGVHRFSFPSQQKKKLDQWLKNKKLTLATFIYSAWGLLLHCYNNSDDIIFGTTVSGRSATIEEIEKTVGLFINTIPLRMQMTAGEGILDLLLNVRNDLINREKHEHDSLIMIKENIDISHIDDLFDTIVIIENYPLDRKLMESKEKTLLKVKSFSIWENPHYDLTLSILISDGIDISFIYNQSLFLKEAIVRLGGHFFNLLQLLYSEDILGKKITEIDCLSESERKELIYSFNQTNEKFDYWKKIHQLYEEQAIKNSDQTALIGYQPVIENHSEKKNCKNGNRCEMGKMIRDENFAAQRVHLTYSELNHGSTLLSEGLLNKGIKSNQLVGVMLNRTIDLLISLLAVLKSGGAYLPISMDYPNNRIAHILSSSHTQLLMIDQMNEKRVGEIGYSGEIIKITRNNINHLNSNLGNKRQYNFRNDQFPEKPATYNDLIYVIFTSGTTGNPKGVMVQHQNVINFIFGMQKEINFSHGKRMICLTTIAFDIFVLESWVPLVFGMQVFLGSKSEQSDSFLLTKLILTQSIDMMQLTPSRLKLIYNSDPSLTSFKGLSELIVGGEAFPTQLLSHLHKVFNGMIYNVYGPTETTVWSSIKDLTLENEVTLGTPIINTQIFIIDRYYRLQPAYIPGELIIGGEGVVRGYLNNPGLTAEKFCLQEAGGAFYKNCPLHPRKNFLNKKIVSAPGKEKFYNTGDLARWLYKGELEFLGRLDHQVKVRGFRIELEEIREKLLHFYDVKDAVLISRVDNIGETIICAYVVFNRDKIADEDKGISNVRQYLSQHLPQYMIPSHILRLKSIPLTTNGKLDQKALPIPSLNIEVTDTPPRNKIEMKMAEVWMHILGINPSAPGKLIGIDQNFFSIGGHSLKATMLSSQIQRHFDIDVPLAEIFNNPSIRKLSRYIAQKSPGQAENLIYSSIQPCEKREFYQLSFAQRRLWVLCQFEADSTAYNMPAAAIFEGVLHGEKFLLAIKTMTQRHESLRTIFKLIEGKPFQKVIPFRLFKIDFQIIDLRGQAIKMCEAKTRQIFTNTANGVFNLEEGPLFLFRLVRWEEKKYVLIYNIHHIISDGWSLGNMNYEILKIYHSFLNGEGNPLPSLKLQYKDYTLWHNRLIEKDCFGHSQSYWIEKFKDKPNGIELPLDRPRKAIQTFNGGRISFFIDEKRTHQLMELSRSTDATLFMTLLTVLNIFLFRYTGQKDIPIGAPIANRVKPELYSMMGFLVNTLVYRNQLDSCQCTLEILTTIKKETLECYQNQDFPFDLLIDQLELDRDLSQSPLFNVMLAHNNAEPWERPLSMEGVKITHYPFIDDFNMSKFDLIFFIDEKENQIQVRLEYNSDLFIPTTIQRMKRNFLTLLDDMILRINTPVSNLNLLCVEEYQQIVDLFNRSDNHFPKESLQELFEYQVEKSPNKVAVVSLEHTEWDMKQGSIQITFDELNQSINHFANFLWERYKVKSNDVIGVSMERSIDMITVLWGIIKAGAAYLALDPTYPRDRVLHVLSDSKSDLLIIDQMRSELFENYYGRIFNIQKNQGELRKKSSVNPEYVNDPKDILYINYTSGSTGTPNGAMLSHHILTNLIRWQNNISPIDSSMSCLQFTSINFCVSFQEIMGPLTAGGRIHLIGDLPRQDIDYLMNFLSNYQIELLFLPFSYLNFLFNESNRWHQSFKHNLKHIITAGEQLKITIGLKRFLESNPIIQLHNHYGSTEMHVVTSYSLDGSNAAQTPIPPAGTPVSNVKIYILDEFLNPVPIGVWGELFVLGCSEILGYIHNDSLTNDKLTYHEKFSRNHERLYRSGDIGRWNPDGTIELRGRKDFMVKVRGFRIELGEIESKILSIVGVRECVVVVKENLKGEKNLVAYISLDQISTQEIERNLNKNLPHYMIPQIVVLDSLPLMPNGKVDREKLPSPNVVVSKESQSPRNSIEEKLVHIWAEVLELDKESIGINRNFFEMGGHSLKATTVLNRIYQSMGINIPLIEMFQRPTIQELSLIIEKSITEKFHSIPAIEKQDFYDVSSVQRRLFILNQLAPNDVNYNMPGCLILPKGTEIGKLTAILRLLIERHESFRSSFRLLKEVPVQQIHDQTNCEIEYYNKNEENGKVKWDHFVRPFDLSQAPLLRVGLVNINASHYLLLVDMHHIISDGASLSILVKEFSALLNNNHLPVLPLQYKDFTKWQNIERNKENHSKQRDYWIKQYKDEIPVLNLPIDFTRPEIQVFSGDRIVDKIDSKQTLKLKEFCLNENITIYMLILATATIWLSKLSQQEDIVIGTPIANRRHHDLEGIIGMFANTLCIRNFPVSTVLIKNFLKSIKKRCLEAFENQDYPYEELVEQVVKKKDTSRNPIFDVMVNVLNQEEYYRAIDDILKDVHHDKKNEKLEYSFKSNTSKFDMNLTVFDMGDNILIELEYCTKLFKANNVKKFSKYFRNILNLIFEDSFRTIAEIDILDTIDKQEVLKMCWGELDDQFEEPATIIEWIEKVAQSNKNNIGLIYQHHQLSYHYLISRANQLAWTLKSKGIGSNKLVAIMIKRSLDLIIGILGILKAGGAYLPIDIEYPTERKRYMLNDSQIELMLVNFPLEPKELSIHDKIEILNLKENNCFADTISSLPSNYQGSDLLYVIYTSGSTGKPKGVILENQNLVNLFHFQYQYSTMDSSRIMQFATISFDASFHEIFTVLLHGGLLLLIDEDVRSEISNLFKLISNNDIKTVFLPMAFLKLLFSQEDYIKEIPTCITHIQTAGEQVVITERFKQFLSNSHISLHNHYGPTETHVVTSYTIQPENEIPELPPIGRPILNSSIFILDSGMNILPVGITGELYIGGIQVGRGYLNNPGLTAEKFCLRRAGGSFCKNYHLHPRKNFLIKSFDQTFSIGTRRVHPITPPAGLYKTGDLGRWLEDGNIQFLGRRDHQVKIRGFRIELGEIESHLLNYPGIKNGAVIARKDENRDKYICAYLVSDREIGQLILREYLLEKLPEYMIPTYFISIEKINFTPNGKIDKRCLPHPKHERSVNENFIEPDSEDEKKMTEIWKDILKLDKISINSPFFDIGGNSLKIILLKDRIKKEFDQDIKITQLFKYTTIQSLVKLLSQQEKPEQLIAKNRSEQFNKAKNIREKRRQKRLSKK